MVAIYDNFHGDLTLKRTCPYCEVEDDTTEHLLDCKTFDSTISSKDLQNDNNIETWRQLLEVVNVNTQHRQGEKVSWTKNRRKKQQQ